MKKIVCLVLFCFCVLPAFAADDASAVTASNELELQLSSEPAVKLGFTRRYTIPFLQGESPLTHDNNIGLSFKAELSPVSLNGLVEAVWTPIAFFQLVAGGSIGSGWNITLFDSEIHGIGVNYADAEGKSAYSGSAFDGLLYKAQAGFVLQADLAAVFPGDWNHVVVRTYHEINGKGYTGAAAGESWYFENDDGENRDGLNYYGNFLLGYQMPLFLNMAAVLLETDLYLYDTPDRGRWGDDKIRWTLSGLLNFSITKQFSTAILAQFNTKRNYTSGSEDLYYQNRTIDNSNPLSWQFYRVAAILTYTL